MPTDIQQLNLPQDFYCDEVREGFYVSETMKRYWAAMLGSLFHIDEICKRHNLNWYADSGTLLGAVRHKGFIPWDDDIDISMMRKDYETFMSLARKELPSGYQVVSSTDIAEYHLPFGKIFNSTSINNHPDFLAENHGCPFVASVDIFPLDNIYNDAAKEYERTKRANLVYSTIQSMDLHAITNKELKILIKQIEHTNNTVISPQNTYKDLMLLLDKISRECLDEHSDEVALIYEWVTNQKCKYKRAWYENQIELPFETVSLSAPACYHEVLSSYYNDYMQIVKGSAVHNFPAYKPSEKIYLENAHSYPSRYHFSKEDFTPKATNKPLKQSQSEVFQSVRSIHDKLAVIVPATGIENAAPFLQVCQKALLTVKNTVSEKFGNNSNAIKALDEYFETIAEASAAWNDTSMNRLNSALKYAEDMLNDQFDSAKKDILFLLCKSSWWDSISDVFNAAVSDPENNVVAIAISYFYLDNRKAIGEAQSDLEYFEKIPEIRDKLTTFSEYNPEKKHPDVIVTQFPFDGHSTILTIPDLLYSGNLPKYTDKLVYVPFVDPEPPTSDTDVAFLALQEIVEQPAVFNADKILLRSAELKDCYIKHLAALAGDETRKYWEDRIDLFSSLFS